MSEMEHNESFDRVLHGLKSAEDAMRKLAKLQKNKDWLNAAFGLSALIKRAQELYDSGSITHSEAIGMLDHMQAKKVIAEGGKKLN